MTDADLTAIATYLKRPAGSDRRRRRRRFPPPIRRWPPAARSTPTNARPATAWTARASRIYSRRWPDLRTSVPTDPASLVRVLHRRRAQRCDRRRADRPRHAVVRMEAERRSGRRGPDLHPQLLGLVGAGRRPASSQSGPRLDGAYGSIANTHRLRAVSLTQRSRSRRSRRICSSPNPRVKRRSAASTGKRSVRPSSRTAVMVCAQSAKAASAASSDEGPRRAASASALWRR